MCFRYRYTQQHSEPVNDMASDSVMAVGNASKRGDVRACVRVYVCARAAELTRWQIVCKQRCCFACESHHQDAALLLSPLDHA